MEEEKINIEKAMFPEAWELIQDEHGNISTTIVDEELDPFKADFENDWCVKINTEGMTHITLSTEVLDRLSEMIFEAQEMYDDMNDNPC